MSALAIDNRPLVLVLDSPAHTVDVVQRWLKDAGFHVQACRTEAMTLTVARMHRRPSVVFSNSGGATLNALRLELPDVPVIVLTTDAGQPSRSLERGARDFVPYPVERVRLVTSLRNAIEHGHLTGQLNAAPRVPPANDQQPAEGSTSAKRKGQRGQAAMFRPPMTLRDLERWAIEVAMDSAGGNVTAVTRNLGIGRTTLYRKLRQYGMR